MADKPIVTPERVGRASAERLKDQEGVVKASDATFASRLAKKMFGSPLSDLSDKELDKLAGLPAMGERARRRELSKKAYLDAILRDFSKLGGEYGTKVGRAARESKLGVDTMVENARKRNNMRYGGKACRGRKAAGSAEKN